MDDLLMLKILMKDEKFRKAYEIERNKCCNCKFTKYLINHEDKKLCNHCGYIVSENKEEVDINSIAQDLHHHGYHIEFQDGYFNSFHEELDRSVMIYQHELLNIIDTLITNDKFYPEIAHHTLRYFGEIEDDNTYDLRLSILAKQLSHKHSYVRDGAGLGIANLDFNLPISNNSVIDKLKLQISKEEFHGLRRDLQLVLDQLEKSKNV